VNPVSTVTPDEVLDVKGEICPYPDIKTRKKLKQMKPGQVLEVLTDYPLSVERIPRNVQKEGHKVLKIERIDGPIHKILIQVGSTG
jgi:tRNA 2-thiouridine synthesizing protein A